MSSQNSKLHGKQAAPARALKRADGSSSLDAPGRRSAHGGHSAVDRQFEVLFSTNPLAMYICNPRTLEILEVNAAALRQYGYSREELLRMKITELRPAEDVSAFLSSLRKNGASPSGVGHVRHRRKSGEVFSVDVTSQSITFNGQDVVLVVTQDISERLAAEQKLAENTAFANALTENNPLAIVALDLDRRVRTCNPAFERLFGYTLGNIVGKALPSLLAPRDGEAEMAGYVRRVMDGEVVRHVGKRRRRDGSLVDVRVLGVPLIVNGKQTGTFGIYEDITERGVAEKAQQAAEEKYRRIFESAVEGFFESTPDCRLVTVNPAMARIAGYASPVEMIREISDLGRPFYADPASHEELKRRLEAEGTVEGFECPMLRKDGSSIWMSMNVRAVRNASGKIVSHDGTAEDVTQSKRSELIRQVTTEIIHAVSVTENLDALLRVIHAALSKVLDAANSFVALRDPATEKFYFPFFVDRYDAAPPPDELQDLGRSCTSYVYRTGEAALISQTRFDQLASKGDVELVGTPCPSWLGAPLRTPAETIGVLVVQNYERDNVYTQRDLEFLSSVGGQIALAIERKRSEERAGKRSSVARADRAAASGVVDRGQESAVHAGGRIGTGTARSEAQPDRGHDAFRIFRNERPILHTDRSALAGRVRRSGDFPGRMEKGLLRLPRGTAARLRGRGARRDLHGAGRYRPQAAGGAVPAGAEDGSRRPAGRRNRARLQ
jgi:PAS domain S-box-containing protein